MEKRDIFDIYLGLNNAVNDNIIRDPLEKAHDIAQHYEELNDFIGKMSVEDASQLLEDIKHAMSLYARYDKITDKIYKMSQKYANK